MVFENLLDPVFAPMLKMNALVAVIILSFVLSLLITLMYKYFTDQKRMKEIKDDVKKYQQKIKESKHDPKKMMDLNKKVMELNFEMMKSSFKPKILILSLLPILIIFPWLNANMAYEPIHANQEFTIILQFNEGTTGAVIATIPEGVKLLGNATKKIQNDTVTYAYKAVNGEYQLNYKYDERTYTKEIRVDQYKYLNPITPVKNSELKSIIANNPQLIVMDLFGWQLGWLGTYIIFSIIFSMAQRKLLKVY